MKLCPVCQRSYPDDYGTCPRDQAVLQSHSGAIRVGSLLRGKYEVLAELGSGGMATVYKVRHRVFQDISAVKVVRPELLSDPDFLKRFRNEAVVARQLMHPNAVRIDDLDYTEDGCPFIVMEYIEGRSLHELRRERPEPWPVDRCLRIVSQAAEALGAAHTLGIVHRDIKPANILLVRLPSGEARVKVLDFGIAKVEEGSIAGLTSVRTETGMIIGTPEYMSPEQASGLLDNSPDGRSDLYSLGLVFYEMLTGSHPFRADTPMGMLIQQINTQPPPPDSVRGVPVAVSALVLKTLRKDPRDRFQSAGELLAALKDPEGWYRGIAGAVPVSPVAHSEVMGSGVPHSEAPLRFDFAGDRAAPEGMAGPPDACKTEAFATTPEAFASTSVAFASTSVAFASRPGEGNAEEAGASVPGAPALGRPARSKWRAVGAAAVLLAVALVIFFFTQPVHPHGAPEGASGVAPNSAAGGTGTKQAPATAAENAQEVLKLIEAGNRSLDAGKDDDASEFFAKALSEDQNNTTAQRGLNTALQRAKRK